MKEEPSTPPIGDPVFNSDEGPPPQRVTLTGRFVEVTPLTVAAHGESLAQNLIGEDRSHLFVYSADGPFQQRSAILANLEAKAASFDPLFFALIDRSTGLALGHMALMRIKPKHRCIEIGHVLFSPALQRTPAATEAMYLLARYVFEDLGYRRYEWKCYSLNEGSQRAARRLGFTYEGTFRQHMIIKGRNRDTAWFSMLDSEWPSRKSAFEKWLDPANFNADGQQRRTLASFREE